MKKMFLFLLSFWAFILMANNSVKAVDTGFQVSQLSFETKNQIFSEIDILVIKDEPAQKSIACFDVNANGVIAIGHHTLSNRKIICVYSNEGVFQYGYSFTDSGDFGIEWDEENLNIYFARSSLLVSVTPQGDVLDVLDVPYTRENNSYARRLLYSTKRIVGDTEYIIGNKFGWMNLFAVSQSQMIKKNSTSEIVLYDVGTNQLINMIGIIFVCCVFVCIFIIAVVKQYKLWMKTQEKRDRMTPTEK